jgi:hypothetical protein
MPKANDLPKLGLAQAASIVLKFNFIYISLLVLNLHEFP